MYNFTKYLQEKLDSIAEGQYTVSNERNVNASFKNNEVIISALSSTITDREATDIPYEINIFTTDIDKVMVDFTMLAKTYSNVPYVEIENNQISTITPFFNTPTVLEKDIGSQHHARLVVFANVNEKKGINNIKSLTIENESVETLNANLSYAVETNSTRISGEELVRSKKKASTVSISFMALNKSTPFFNKAFKIATGTLSGNTAFTVKATLDNGMETTLTMFITSYNLSSERTRLPSVNISLGLYNN